MSVVPKQIALARMPRPEHITCLNRDPKPLPIESAQLEFELPDYEAKAALIADTSAIADIDLTSGEHDEKLTKLCEEYKQHQRDLAVLAEAIEQVRADMDRLKETFCDKLCHGDKLKKARRSNEYLREYREAFELAVHARRQINKEMEELHARKEVIRDELRMIMLDEQSAFLRQKTRLTNAKSKLQSKYHKTEYIINRLKYQIQQWHYRRKLGYEKPAIPEPAKGEVDYEYIVPSADTSTNTH